MESSARDGTKSSWRDCSPLGAIGSIAMKTHAFVLLALMTFAAGHAVGEPATASDPDQVGRPNDQADAAQTPADLTPAQLVAQDFQIMAQEHATVGAAKPRQDDAPSR
jgi:hypothetical protein